MSISTDKKYNHSTIEEKWLKVWEEAGLFLKTEKGNNGSLDHLQHEQVQNEDSSIQHQTSSIKDKIYLLFAFAYPSGSGLHVGHVESKTALDILARFNRMHGKEVFFPVGWDAFGLPAENYAIKTGIPPSVTTRQAIDTFRRQIKRLGISYDWANELATCHPGYYKWTQWLFLQLYNKGLAYKKPGMVNWCPSCQTVLANEQVVQQVRSSDFGVGGKKDVGKIDSQNPEPRTSNTVGVCERCETPVIQKEMNQWYFKITDYANELISGLEQVDWPEATKKQQLEWIGKAKGLNIDFKLQNSDIALTVWTKFWETVFGTTYLVIAPEKFTELNLIKLVPASYQEAVNNYLADAAHKTEEQRKIGEKDKTGVDTGLMVTNPVNGSEVPLYIADYVLMNVGTGVVMGVPSHDTRDFAFAKKFDLPCIQVVAYDDPAINQKVSKGEMAFEGEGALINSGQFDGLAAWGEGKQNMAEWMINQSFAAWNTTYRLRDWLISRQRYWGAPIPIVYDPEGKPHPVKEEHLPWILPTDVDYNPKGKSPLASSKELFSRVEQLYGKGWTPEVDTMDTFVDSSWYYLRYVSARDEGQFMSKAQAKAWLPVDFYMIGPEHIVLHLLYSRFLTKFLRDQGYLDFNEPFIKMRHQGMILGPDHKKMSKSKGNVITPDEIIEAYGADTLRMYEMFMGPLEADKPWDPRAVAGVSRFLKRYYAYVSAWLEKSELPHADKQMQRFFHQALKKVSEDLPRLKFNTAIAAMMELLNHLEAGLAQDQWLGKEDIQKMVLILAPFAPFMAEEMWQEIRAVSDERRMMGKGVEESGDEQRVTSENWKVETSIHTQAWPEWDEAVITSDEVTIVVQINGKKRGEVKVQSSKLKAQKFEEELLRYIQADAKLSPWLEGKQIRKTILVKPGEKHQGLINLVVT